MFKVLQSLKNILTNILLVFLLISDAILFATNSAFGAVNFWGVRTSGVIENLRDVSFVNPTHGFVAVRSGTILSTANGGTTTTTQRKCITPKSTSKQTINPPLDKFFLPNLLQRVL